MIHEVFKLNNAIEYLEPVMAIYFKMPLINFYQCLLINPFLQKIYYAFCNALT